ncbi:MAG: DNA translocase FtsK 4TM domain-containing protein, partial [Anaerolineae bacterium]|nr:DNA translocase FtsK 4TM domain-containing protein [Anaerolineae bacterium]
MRRPGRQQADDDERQPKDEQNERRGFRLGRSRDDTTDSDNDRGSGRDTASGDDWNFARNRYAGMRRPQGTDTGKPADKDSKKDDDSGGGRSFLRRNRGGEADEADKTNKKDDDAGGGRRFFRRGQDDDNKADAKNEPRARSSASFAAGGTPSTSARSKKDDADDDKDKSGGRFNRFRLGGKKEDDANSDKQTEDRLKSAAERRGSQSRRTSATSPFRSERDKDDTTHTERRTGSSYLDRNRTGTGGSSSSGSSASPYRSPSQSRRTSATSPFRSERDQDDTTHTEQRTGSSYLDRNRTGTGGSSSSSSSSSSPYRSSSSANRTPASSFSRRDRDDDEKKDDDARDQRTGSSYLDRNRTGTGGSSSSPYPSSSQTSRTPASSFSRRDRDDDERKDDDARDRRPGSPYQSQRPATPSSNFDRSRTSPTGVAPRSSRPAGAPRPTGRTEETKKPEEKKGGIFSRLSGSRGKQPDAAKPAEKKDASPPRSSMLRSGTATGTTPGAATSRQSTTSRSSASSGQIARARPADTSTTRRSSPHKSAAQSAVKAESPAAARKSNRRARPVDAPKQRSRAGVKKSDPLPDAQAKGAFTLHQGLDLDRKLDLIGLTLIFFAVITFSAVLPSLSFGAMPQPEGGLSGTVNDILSQAFGRGKIVWPIVAFGLGVWLMVQKFEDAHIELDYFRIVGVISLYACALTWIQMIELFNNTQPSIELFEPISRTLALDDGGGGGWIGHQIYILLLGQLLDFGAISVLVAWLVMSLMLTFDLSLVELLAPVIGFFGFLHIDRAARARKRAAKEAMTADVMAAMRPGEKAEQLTLAAAANTTQAASTDAAPAVPDPNSPPKPPPEHRHRRLLGRRGKEETEDTQPEAAEAAEPAVATEASESVEAPQVGQAAQVPSRSTPIINRRPAYADSAEAVDDTGAAQAGAAQEASITPANEEADAAEGPARRRMPRLRRTTGSMDAVKVEDHSADNQADNSAAGKTDDQTDAQEEKSGGGRFGFLRRRRDTGEAETSANAVDALAQSATSDKSGDVSSAARPDATSDEALPPIPVPSHRSSAAATVSEGEAAASTDAEPVKPSRFGSLFRRGKSEAAEAATETEAEIASVAVVEPVEAKTAPTATAPTSPPTRPDRAAAQAGDETPAPSAQTEDEFAHRFGRPRPERDSQTETTRYTDSERSAAAFDRSASRATGSTSDGERPRRRIPSLTSPFTDLDDEATADEKSEQDEVRAEQHGSNVLAAAAGMAGIMGAATVMDSLNRRRAPTADAESDDTTPDDAEQMDRFPRRTLPGMQRYPTGRSANGDAENAAPTGQTVAAESANAAETADKIVSAPHTSNDPLPTQRASSPARFASPFASSAAVGTEDRNSDTSDAIDATDDAQAATQPAARVSPFGALDDEPDHDAAEAEITQTASEPRAQPARPDLLRRRQKLTERNRAARFAPVPKMGQTA